jgi:flotillin
MFGDTTMLFFAVIVFVLLMFFAVIFMANQYKRCPSDRILVISGRVGRGLSSRCMHGGGAFVWPLVQEYRYMSLTPLTINIPLQNALSLQNIRINVPSTFTVGISTQPDIMANAAERLLPGPQLIEAMAKEIIFGQLRLTVASLTIEQINQDRESFLEAVRKNVEPELNKIGLYLINVNITDITDESEYIESIGKKAASEAVNRAKVDVAQQTKIGTIGESRKPGRSREGQEIGPGQPAYLRPAARVRSGQGREYVPGRNRQLERRAGSAESSLAAAR